MNFQRTTQSIYDEGIITQHSLDLNHEQTQQCEAAAQHAASKPSVLCAVRPAEDSGLPSELHVSVVKPTLATISQNVQKNSHTVPFLRHMPAWICSV